MTCYILWLVLRTCIWALFCSRMDGLLNWFVPGYADKILVPLLGTYCLVCDLIMGNPQSNTVLFCCPVIPFICIYSILSWLLLIFCITLFVPFLFLQMGQWMESVSFVWWVRPWKHHRINLAVSSNHSSYITDWNVSCSLLCSLTVLTCICLLGVWHFMYWSHSALWYLYNVKTSKTKYKSFF